MEGEIEDGASVQGRVAVGKGSRIRQGAKVRGPSIIGEDSVLENGVYVGPYTSVGNSVTIRRGEIEDSIIMDHCTIDAPYRITSSIIGTYTTIRDSGSHTPKGIRLTLGENCQLDL
jgi:glucose-1-phosphate thymidylyltransferase